MSPDGFVDLRSDTVTRPTPTMRRAMAEAEVGDDGYGEDPTVRTLEERFAERVGKPAAVYVPTGTMANQLAIRIQAKPGSAVIAGRHAHLVAYELGASARNAGVQLDCLDDDDGHLDPERILAARAATSFHQPEVGLVCLEDTHMASGGTPLDPERVDVIVKAAGSVPIHLDGARLFNAEVATGTTTEQRARPATTVMCCMSKGLGAPVGSLLAGPTALIAEARIERVRLGGAMRQSGIIAAAGLVALDSMIDRLADDHRRARRLAEAVGGRWGIDTGNVQTNIVVFRPPDPGKLLDHLRAEGVLAGMIGPGVVRLVTHLDIDDAGIERALTAVASAP